MLTCEDFQFSEVSHLAVVFAEVGSRKSRTFLLVKSIQKSRFIQTCVMKYIYSLHQTCKQVTMMGNKRKECRRSDSLAEFERKGHLP
jgi:hypothetical protein